MAGRSIKLNKMKNFLKGKLGTVIIIIATLVLAGVAIFTAVRLYQLRQQAVAPTAPESKPEAAVPILKCEPVTIKVPGPSPSPEVPTCIGIKAYDKTWKSLTKADLSKLKAGDTVRLTVEGSSSSPDSGTPSVLFSIAKFKFQGSAGWTSTTLKKPNTNIFYFDYILPKNVTNFTVKAQVGYGQETRETWVACTDLAFSLGVIPTPVGCNKSCNLSVNPQITCEEDLICRSASGGITGASGFCRNPDCPGRADCICPTATPTSTSTATGTPTATATATGGGTTPAATAAGGGGQTTTTESLPDSGTSWPTIIGAGVGILVILGSLLLAL